MMRKTFCLLLFISGFGVALAEEEDQISKGDAGLAPGKSVVIEFEEDSPKPVDETSRKPANKFGAKKKESGRREVELIVGGQGEDGVAKHGKLVIDD